MRLRIVFATCAAAVGIALVILPTSVGRAQTSTTLLPTTSTTKPPSTTAPTTSTTQATATTNPATSTTKAKTTTTKQVTTTTATPTTLIPPPLVTTPSGATAASESDLPTHYRAGMNPDGLIVTLLGFGAAGGIMLRRWLATRAPDA